MIISGKIWGTTQPIIQNSMFEIHRITVKSEGYCSKHLHKHKFNSFWVESGRLEVTVWKSDYDLVDVTILKFHEQTIVPPGEYHRFKALEPTVAYECYWTELLHNDIVREDHGGEHGPAI